MGECLTSRRNPITGKSATFTNLIKTTTQSSHQLKTRPNPMSKESTSKLNTIKKLAESSVTTTKKTGKTQSSSPTSLKKKIVDASSKESSKAANMRKPPSSRPSEVGAESENDMITTDGTANLTCPRNTHMQNRITTDRCTSRAPVRAQEPRSTNTNEIKQADVTVPAKDTQHAASISERNIKARYMTFENWPLKFLTPLGLAKNGFRYTGKKDIVKCVYCGVEIGYWEEADLPSTEHKKHSPRCVFVNNENVDNEVDAMKSDECGARTRFVPNNDIGVYNGLGVEIRTAFAYPNYASHSSRLESYREWPVSMKQRPEDMADAGFFYTGHGDRVKCFHCGVGLKDWEPEDSAWDEHALWSPKCQHLLMKMGVDFVLEVNAKGPNRLSLKDFEPEVPMGNLNIVAVEEPKAQPNDVVVKENGGTLCGICYDKERSIVYLPCGHLIACSDCGAAANFCPICRKEIKAFVRAYLP